MKPKKTVTSKVMAANRNNAEGSTGPKTDQGKANSSGNAIRHGLLSRTARFEEERDRDRYNAFYASLVTENRPRNAIEAMLVERIAIGYWRYQTALRWEMAAVNARRHTAKLIMQALAVSDAGPKSDPRIPLISECEPLELTEAGWDVAELSVHMERSVEGAQQTQQERRVKKAVVGRSGVESEQAAGNLAAVKLTSSLDLIFRYGGEAARDIDRSIVLLKRLQTEEN